MRLRNYLQNLKLDSWPVLIGGLVLSAAISCMAATTPGTTTTTTSTSWTTTMVAQSAASPSTASSSHSVTAFYTPFPFSTILNDTIARPALSPVTTVTARTRYLISPAANQFLSIATPSSSAATTVGLTTNGSTVTYANLLAEVVEAVPDTTNSAYFRLDSDLHSLYSLDESGGSLVFQNNWGTAAAPSGRGYLLFEYNGTSKKLIVRGRYTYDTSAYSHTAVSSYAKVGYEVAVSGSSWSLAASGSGTELTLSTAPVSVASPTDFYPEGTAYVSNSRVSISNYVTVSNGALAGTVSQNLVSGYAAQVAAVGDDSGTATAASAALDAIEASLTSEGAALRYPKAAYLAFRKAVLNAVLKSDDIANGTLDMHAVPYAYFTNATDGGSSASPTGTHHPFLVLASYSLTDRPNRLVDVRRPPGDGVGSGYDNQNVTRDATLGKYLIKIPLRNYGEVSSLTENTYQNTLKADGSYTDTDSVYNKASISGLGVLVDGSPLYPVMNNTLVPSQSEAELTSLGNHVGRGMELHYHADGHVALNNDFQLYNMNDYVGQNHPPLIGFGLDGVALFGVYESLHPNM